MAGVDIHAEVGAAEWVAVDGQRLQHAIQRARFDLMGIASRRALSGDIAAGNAEVKALLDQNPLLRGWVVVNPAYPERSSEELRRHVGSAKWLGAMLHPGKCGQSLLSAASREVLNAYRRYTKPILIDVPDEPAVRELEVLAAEFNTLKFIAARAGGDSWHSCALAAKKDVNIFLEPFTGGPHRGKLEAILQLLGPHRLVFASGYPDMNPGAALGLLLEAKVSDGERQAILTNSAVRLFGLARS